MKRINIARFVIFALLFSPTALRADNGPAHRVDQPFPLQLGTSGGNINDISKGFCYGGTLGSLVEKNGVQYILSNNHVLARTNLARIGESIIQPGLIDQTPGCAKDVNDIVANLSAFIPIQFKTKRTIPSNIIDAAIAEVRAGAVDPTGAILDIGVISADTADPVLNLPVQKSGRTSGLTHGTVSGINATVDVSYGSGNTARFQNQILITPGSFLAGGDSGSLMVEDGVASPKAVGLLFAGSSSIAIANPIHPVLNAFGVTMVGSGGSARNNFLNRSFAALKNILQARESYAQSLRGRANPAAVAAVARLKERHEGKHMSVPGVVGMGVGLSNKVLGQPAIEIYVKQATAAVRRSLPESLDGVEVKVIQTGEFRAY